MFTFIVFCHRRHNLFDRVPEDFFLRVVTAPVIPNTKNHRARERPCHHKYHVMRGLRIRDTPCHGQHDLMAMVVDDSPVRITLTPNFSKSRKCRLQYVKNTFKNLSYRHMLVEVSKIKLGFPLPLPFYTLSEVEDNRVGSTL